jgi:ABC-type long-subunit fatty acid transport system fused permease/ATPase subunit
MVPREIAFEYEINYRENENNRADGEIHVRKYDVVLRKSQRIYCHCVLPQIGNCAACSEL